MVHTPTLYIYNCPIRGEFPSHSAEEEHVIACLNWLIETRNVPKENILIDVTLAKLGSKGRNSIRPDIIVFNCCHEEAKNKSGEINKEKVVLLAEIKVDIKDKKSAIQHQLLPAIEMCKNAVGGIYWDGFTKNYVARNGKEYSILSLPNDFIYGKTEIPSIKIEDLMPIDKGVSIWKILDQALRNGGASSKSESYQDLFKILTSKYYDETKNIDLLKFQVADNTKEEVHQRISKLYEEANNYYRLHKDLVDKEEIGLSPDTLLECVKILEGYSLKNTNRSIMQEFYMNFAPLFLKKDLQQYYTPTEIVAFMTENIKLCANTLAVDPCCGTGDFMVGVLREAKDKNIPGKFEDGLYCWDIDKEASKLAKINMILNGDGRTHVSVINSLDEWDKDENIYDFVITNPPFGTGTKYNADNLKRYQLSEIKNNQTGKLFLERGLNLLKEGGCLISVVPVGYLVNPSDKGFREILFARSRVVGCINLPAGAFKEAGTSVKTSVIILQKVKPKKNYKIFTAVANEIGYDVKKKGAPLLIERREDDGAYIRDRNNKLKIKNDLIVISKQLKTFAFDEKIAQFNAPDEKLSYSYTTFEQIKKNGYSINSKIHDEKTGYLSTVADIKKKKHFRLLDGHMCSIKVSTKDDSLHKESRCIYDYIETGGVYEDAIMKISKLRGWDLPERAQQRIKVDDVLVAKMGGSNSSFFYCIPKYAGALVSNGFYKVNIEDEQLRLSFFRFLFTDEYKIQSQALSTGTIMPDIKITDFLEKMYIPILETDEIEQVKKYLTYKKEFVEW